MSERVRLILVGPDGGTGGPGTDIGGLARTLRDRGTEVILLDEARSARHVAAVAMQEDVDAVLLPEAPEGLVAAVRDELGAGGADDVAVVAGEAGTCVARLPDRLGVVDLTPRGGAG
jgi:methylmalonyl-CoA mutase cobalamin-binding domain/chain